MNCKKLVLLITLLFSNMILAADHGQSLEGDSDFDKFNGIIKSHSSLDHFFSSAMQSLCKLSNFGESHTDLDQSVSGFFILAQVVALPIAAPVRKHNRTEAREVTTLILDAYQEQKRDAFKTLGKLHEFNKHRDKKDEAIETLRRKFKEGDMLTNLCEETGKPRGELSDLLIKANENNLLSPYGKKIKYKEIVELFKNGYFDWELGENVHREIVRTSSSYSFDYICKEEQRIRKIACDMIKAGMRGDKATYQKLTEEIKKISDKITEET